MSAAPTVRQLSGARRRLPSDPDVRANTGERQNLVGCCRWIPGACWDKPEIRDHAGHWRVSVEADVRGSVAIAAGMSNLGQLLSECFKAVAPGKQILISCTGVPVSAALAEFEF